MSYCRKCNIEGEVLDGQGLCGECAVRCRPAAGRAYGARQGGQMLAGPGGKITFRRASPMRATPDPAGPF